MDLLGFFFFWISRSFMLKMSNNKLKVILTRIFRGQAVRVLKLQSSADGTFFR